MDIIKIVKKAYKFAQSAKEFGWCSKVLDSNQEYIVNETIDECNIILQANSDDTISANISYNSRRFLNLTFPIDISYENLAKKFSKALESEIKFWNKRLKVFGNFI